MIISDTSTYSFRSATFDDFDHIFDLKRLGYQDVVIDQFGAWDEEWQRSRFNASWNPAHYQLIVFEKRDAGVIATEERAEEIFLAEIIIIPDMRGRGLGTLIMKNLIRHSSQLGKTLALQVLKKNVQAKSLYEKMGFVIIMETSTHYQMQCLR